MGAIKSLLAFITAIINALGKSSKMIEDVMDSGCEMTATLKTKAENTRKLAELNDKASFKEEREKIRSRFEDLGLDLDEVDEVKSVQDIKKEKITAKSKDGDKSISL